MQKEISGALQEYGWGRREGRKEGGREGGRKERGRGEKREGEGRRELEYLEEGTLN